MRLPRSLVPVLALSSLLLAPVPAFASENPPPGDGRNAPERIAQDLTVGVEQMRESIPSQSYTAPSTIAPQGAQRDSQYSVAILQRFSWPVPQLPQSSGFGPRDCDPEMCSPFHQGIDLTPGAGVPIKSVTGGTVRSAGWADKYGYAVTVDHVVDGQAVSTLYAHMQENSIEVHQGQNIERGTHIGRVGDTGQSYGAHLHFEVRVNNSVVNPVPWMQQVGALEYPVS